MKLLPLLLTICLVPAYTPGATVQPDLQSASRYWQKGLEAARGNVPDSAQVFLKQAYRNGIADDSLFYLWAEIFLSRNVLDTALALNFSIKPESNGIRQKSLEQRQLIYTKLGWNNEAAAIGDSLSGRRGRVLRRIVPECNFALTGGGYREKCAADRGYPYARLSDSSALISDGIGDASLRMGWQIKTGETQNLQFGARLRYSGSRFSRASLDKRFNDSTDISAGGFLRYKLFSNRLALDYSCNRRLDFLDRESFLHQFTIQYAVITKTWLASLYSGYQYRNPFQRHYCYLTGQLDKPIGRKNDLGLMLKFAGLAADDKPIVMLRQPYSNYNDSRIYSDPTLTVPVTYILREKPEFPFDAIMYDTLTIESSIPQSFLEVGPKASFERHITKKFSAGLHAGYRMNWFLKEYTWVDFGHSLEGPALITINATTREELVRDAATGNYYWVTNIGFRDSKVTLETHPIAFHRERRVDQTLSLNLFLNYTLNRLGSMMFDITMERNFSTLTENAPVDIQKWYGEMTLTWFFRFKP